LLSQFAVAAAFLIGTLIVGMFLLRRGADAPAADTSTAPAAHVAGAVPREALAVTPTALAEIEAPPAAPSAAAPIAVEELEVAPEVSAALPVARRVPIARKPVAVGATPAAPAVGSPVATARAAPTPTPGPSVKPSRSVDAWDADTFGGRR
jgi:hypothetical protein